MLYTEILNGREYTFNLLFLIVGILFLVKGADYFVASASAIARKLKIPPIIIGLTVVSFGTSAPELAVAIAASLKGDSGLALSNVVGSNIANATLVLGLSVVVAPILVKKSIVKSDLPFLLITTILLLIFSLDNLFSGFTGIQNSLSRGESFIFLAGIILFCILSIQRVKKEEPTLKEENAEMKDKEQLSGIKIILLLVVGLVGIITGAEFVTTPASLIATSIGITLGVEQEAMKNLVGLTIVAVGTSLPELVTSLVAAKKKENEIALGNVVGSNIFNILFICGISGLITPLTISSDILTDMVISLVLTVLVLWFSKEGKLGRGQGCILLLCYILYLMYIGLRLFYPMLVLPV